MIIFIGGVGVKKKIGVEGDPIITALLLRRNFKIATTCLSISLVVHLKRGDNPRIESLKLTDMVIQT